MTSTFARKGCNLQVLLPWMTEFEPFMARFPTRRSLPESYRFNDEIKFELCSKNKSKNVQKQSPRNPQWLLCVEHTSINLKKWLFFPGNNITTISNIPRIFKAFASKSWKCINFCSANQQSSFGALIQKWYNRHEAKQVAKFFPFCVSCHGN